MLEEILALLAGLAGLGGLISVLVNLLKILGVVKDGTSETWVQLFNLVAFLAVAVIYFIKIPIDWSGVDSWLKLLATFIGYILEIFAGKVTYIATKGAPVVGFRYSEVNKG